MASDEAEQPSPPSGEPRYSLAELVERTALPARTIRWYQSEGLVPKPAKNGRDAVYGPEHVERLRLIAELRDRGLTLVAIRDLLKGERPSSTVAEWLGIDATLTAPWSDDRPRVVDRDELAAMTKERRPGLLAELQDAGYVQPADPETWLVPSPALLGLALQLHDAGIEVELSAQLRDLLRRRLSKVVDDAVKLLVERAGAGFAGNATAAELATAVGALRPVARETTSLIMAQEVERALRQLVDRGPAAIERARRH
ncbi:MAG TPA: MerR family transcriptional regulator [Acidimicrobiia bacterium]|jgi:DNA-binding transcriptional MerR regulator|nr:MerR family transcriptional regulator [Acidimicrobiia bacterium]